MNYQGYDLLLKMWRFCLRNVDYLLSPQKTHQKHSNTIKIAHASVRIEQITPSTIVLATNAKKNLPFVMHCLRCRNTQAKFISYDQIHTLQQMVFCNPQKTQKYHRMFQPQNKIARSMLNKKHTKIKMPHIQDAKYVVQILIGNEQV